MLRIEHSAFAGMLSRKLFYAEVNGTLYGTYIPGQLLSAAQLYNVGAYRTPGN